MKYNYELNQSQIAVKLGVNPQALSQIRSGTTQRPSNPLVIGLQQFGINHAWVLTGHGEMLQPGEAGQRASGIAEKGRDYGGNAPPSVAAGGGWTVSLSDQEAELVMIHRKLDQEGREAVLDFAHAALETPGLSTDVKHPARATPRAPETKQPSETF